jgi:hypothetical protein
MPKHLLASLLTVALLGCGQTVPSPLPTGSAVPSPTPTESRPPIPADPVDALLGEAWLEPNLPPPHRETQSETPNIALMTADALWTHIEAADPAGHRAIVILKRANLERSYFRDTPLLSEEEFTIEKDQLLNELPDLIDVVDLPDGGIRFANGTRLPAFGASIPSKELLAELVASPLVDVVEPGIRLFDSLACGFDPYVPSSDPRAQDGELTGSGPRADLVPYTFEHHQVKEAWTRSARPGDGEGIAVLDTGVSDTQQQFSSRYSLFFPRLDHLRLNKTADSPNDVCGHGTKEASIAAAPHDGLSIVGGAWGAPLTTIKLISAPWAKNTDVSAICGGIADAVKPPDGRAPARVVSMAFGLLYHSPTIEQCIGTAFRESPGTVFLAAAGSLLPAVVFPATLNEFVLAISAVELSPSGSGYRLIGRPGTVAYGPEVDFVSVLDYGAGIPASGKVGDEETDEITKLGMSSAATAVYAGLVSVAAQHASSEGWTRAQLVSALRMAASRASITDYSGEPVEAVIGAGILDLYRASGGARQIAIHGSRIGRVTQSVHLTAETDAIVPPGADPPDYFSYKWTVRGIQTGTGQSLDVHIRGNEAGPIDVEVSAVDSFDGTMLTAKHRIEVVSSESEPTIRTFQWTSYVVDFPTFLNGGRHDRIINAGIEMPTDCDVAEVLGLLVDKNGRAAAGDIPESSADRGDRGFTIVRLFGRPGNHLEAVVHHWHGALNAVRTKVVYKVVQPPGVDCMVADVLEEAP